MTLRPSSSNPMMILPPFLRWRIQVLALLLLLVLSFLTTAQGQERGANSNNNGNDDDILNFGDIELDLNKGWIHLPNFEIEENVLGFPLALNLTNMICQISDYGQFTLDHHHLEQAGAATPAAATVAKVIEAAFHLQGLSLSCLVDFDTTWFFFSGKGRVTLLSMGNQLQTQMIFSSQLQELPEDTTPTSTADTTKDPSSSTTTTATTWDYSMTSCDPNFHVIYLSFDDTTTNDEDNVAVFVLNALEPVLKETVEVAMQLASCQIAQATEGIVDNILGNVTSLLAEISSYYYQYNNNNDDDVNFNIPVIDYTNPQTVMARLISFGLKTVGNFLSTSTATATTTTTNETSTTKTTTASNTTKRMEDAILAGNFHDAAAAYEQQQQQQQQEQQQQQREEVPPNNTSKSFLSAIMDHFFNPNNNDNDYDDHNTSTGIISVPFLEGRSIVNSILPLLDSRGNSNTNNINRGTVKHWVQSVMHLLGISDIRINQVTLQGLDDIRFPGGTNNDGGGGEGGWLTAYQQTIAISNVDLSSISILVQGQIELLEEEESTTTNDAATQQTLMVVQPFDFQIDITDINASAAVLLALDEIFMNQELRIGNLLSLGDILCNALRGVHKFDITSLTLGDFMDINFNLSTHASTTTTILPSNNQEGTTAAAAASDSTTATTLPLLLSTIMNSGILEFGWALYKDTILQSLPDIIRGIVPSLLEWLTTEFTSNPNSICNNKQTLASSTTNSSSNSSSELSALLDFRDLFLSSLEASHYGARGEEPYGNLISKAKDFMDENLLQVVATMTATKGNMSGTVTEKKEEAQGALLLEVNDKVIRPFTEQLSGMAGTLELSRFQYNTTTTNSSTNLIDIRQGFNVGQDLDLTIGLGISTVTVENLDTVASPTTLAEPQMGSASSLYNRIVLGLPLRPIRFQTEFSVDIDINGEMNVHNKFLLQVETDSIDLSATPVVKILEHHFLNFPLGDILNIQCWFAALAASEEADKHDATRVNGTATSSISFSELSLLVGDSFQFNVTCVDCSGSTAERIINIVNRLDDNDNGFFASPNEMVETLFSLVLGETEEETAEGGGYPSMIKMQLDRMLKDASKHCPHHPDFDPDAPLGLRKIKLDSLQSDADSENEPVSFLIPVLSLVGLAVLATAGILFLLYLVLSVRYYKWLEKLPQEWVESIYQQAKKENKRKARVNLLCGPLTQSQHVSLLMKFAVPTLLLASAALFLCGILSEALTVKINVAVGGRGVYATELPFTVVRVASDAWHLGGKGLAIFVIAGSGAWPQIKQLGTILCWFLPPSILPVGARGWILNVFDFLGKWTMVSVFLFFISIAVFRFEISSPQKLLSEELYHVDVLLVPSFGLYATSIAQILALITSQVCIRYHYYVVSRAEAEDNVLHLEQLPTNAKFKEDENQEVEETPIASKQPLEDSNVKPNIIISKESMEVTFPETEREDSTRQDEEVAAKKITTDIITEHQTTAKARALCSIIYSSIGPGTPRIATIMINACLVSIVCLVPALVVTGCIYPSFSREIQGLVGLVINAGGSSETEFGVFSTISRFLEHASLLEIWQFVGHLWLAALLVLTVCLVPLAQSLALGGQFFVPLTQRWRHRLQVSLGVMQSLQSIEVFLLSAIMFALQLGGMTQTILPKVCQPLENITSSLVTHGVLDEGDKCFGYDGSVRFASLLLLFAVILLYLLMIVVSLAKSYAKDDETSARAGVALGVATNKAEANGGSGTPAAEFDSSGFLEKIYTFPLLFDIFYWIVTQRLQKDKQPEQDTDDSSLECR